MAEQAPQRKYVAVLAVVSGLILIIGTRFKPHQSEEQPPAQTEIVRLQLAAQRRNLEDLTSYFAQAAAGVKPELVWIRGLETSGVVWEAHGLIVTAAPPDHVRRQLTTGRYQLTPEVVSIHYPVSALLLPANAAMDPVFRTTADNLTQGGWILQVAAKNDGGHLYAPGTFEGVVAADCGGFRVNTVETNLPLDETSVGGGVFDLSGNLHGVVLRCNDHYAAVTPEGIDRILQEARSFEGQLLRFYGIRAEPLTGEYQHYFGTDRGLLVTEVWNGWPADTAGIVPGDIIQALDDGEVTVIDDLARLLLPVAYSTFDMWLWRRKKTEKVILPASRAEQPTVSSPGGRGIVLRSNQEGYLIDDVGAGSRAEMAALERGDRLLLIAGRRPRDLGAAIEVLGESDRPVYIVVQRGRRKIGAYLR